MEDAEGAYLPFWSPDSDFIGFAAGGELSKISVEGGLSIRLCPLPSNIFAGGAWSPGGDFIVFSSGNYELYEVPARGGETRLLISPEPSDSSSGGPSGILARPHFLPPEAGGRLLVYTFGTTDLRTMIVQDLDSGQREILGPGTHPFYSPSGHLIYQSQMGIHDLWALPFSLDTLQAAGEAFPVAQDRRGPTVAADQTLVYLDSDGGGQRQLIWRNRAGEKLGEIGQPQEDMRYPVLSPDGRRVAVMGIEGVAGQALWVHEVERPIKRRLTFDASADTSPQWSPSGREITFQSSRGESFDIFERAADGTGEAVLLVGAEVDERPYGWSRDGDYLVYTSLAEGGYDIWYLKRKGDGEEFESIEFMATPFFENAPNLSPDGRFLAYCSDASGVFQVYVRPFPSGDGQWQVSERGGCQPRWSRDGTELFYVEGDTLMAVEVTDSPSFAPLSTTALFSNAGLSAASVSQVTYDVAADGRFVMTDSVEGAEQKPPAIRVVQNWYEEFRGREQE